MGGEKGDNIYPWVVRLSIDTGASNRSCGGTLISKKHVLSALLCARIDSGIATTAYVELGLTSKSSDAELVILFRTADLQSDKEQAYQHMHPKFVDKW